MHLSIVQLYLTFNFFRVTLTVRYIQRCDTHLWNGAFVFDVGQNIDTLIHLRLYCSWYIIVTVMPIGISSMFSHFSIPDKSHLIWDALFFFLHTQAIIYHCVYHYPCRNITKITCGEFPGLPLSFYRLIEMNGYIA